MVAPPIATSREGQLNAPDPLTQLRDVHLPDAVSAWPPAPGWWLLALFVVIGLIALIRSLWRHYQRRAYVREARLKLQALSLQPLSPQQQLQQANDILKRCAMTAYPKSSVASLSGESWLVFLDQHCKTPLFGDHARWLESWFRYDVSADLSRDFIQRAERWVQQQPRKNRHV